MRNYLAKCPMDLSMVCYSYLCVMPYWLLTPSALWKTTYAYTWSLLYLNSVIVSALPTYNDYIVSFAYSQISYSYYVTMHGNHAIASYQQSPMQPISSYLAILSPMPKSANLLCLYMALPTQFPYIYIPTPIRI